MGYYFKIINNRSLYDSTQMVIQKYLLVGIVLKQKIFRSQIIKKLSKYGIEQDLFF